MREEKKLMKIATYKKLLDEYTFERNFTRIANMETTPLHNLHSWVKTFRIMVDTLEDMPWFEDSIKHEHSKLSKLVENVNGSEMELYMIMRSIFARKHLVKFKVLSFRYEYFEINKDTKHPNVILLTLLDENNSVKLVEFTKEIGTGEKRLKNLYIHGSESFLYDDMKNRVDISDKELYISIDINHLDETVIDTDYFLIDSINNNIEI